MAKSYMEYHRNFFYNFKRYGVRLSGKEIKGSIITIIILAFVLSFREWGDKTFNFSTGIMNYAIAIVLVAVALFFNQLGQRIIAVYYGYDPVYEASILGLMISLVICFASRGLFVVIMPGYVVIHMLAASRLGEFRYYTNLWEWAKSLFGAPLANFLVACILSFFAKDNFIITKLMTINIYFAIYSLVPLPNNPGMYMFWYHKYFWGFAVGFILGGIALLLITSPLIALIGSLITGTIALYVYFVVLDKKLG
ncbi:hypothetical protein JXB41_08605 [Candidatus Woesearchaeota archaeon]|nr:hypothetical protein [Candidatus Woesearchaeota archaeon]